MHTALETISALPLEEQDNMMASNMRQVARTALACGHNAGDKRGVAELVDALENLARLGNGEHYGNSDGNMIARTALSKYKGAK